MPDILLVALGLDAYWGVPLSELAVTTDWFRRAAASIRRFADPIGILQEGGHSCSELGENLSAFLGAAIDG